MNTHLSQSIGAGAFEGQHGMSLAISSAVADTDISSTIDTSEVVPAMTGRDNGANTRPAIMKIASSRRMVIWQSTLQNPTDATKLKAFQANDVVPNPRPIELPSLTRWPNSILCQIIRAAAGIVRSRTVSAQLTESVPVNTIANLTKAGKAGS
jgi:hypothetical protein